MGEVHYSLERNTCNRSVSNHNLYINCVGSTSSNNGIYNNQLRYDYYLIYMQEGYMDLETKKIKVNLKKGQFIILPPHTRSIYSSPKRQNINYLWLHFTGRNAEELIKDVNLDINVPYTIGVQSIFINYWKSLYREFVTNDIHFVNACGNILNSIFIDLSRYTHNKLSTYNLKSIHYIHENLFSELSLKTLAEIENLSESRYRALFTKITGVSPVNYIINQRIDASMAMLTNTSASVAEIAKSVGYYDAYYFSRLFKKRTGMSPSKYRKQN